MNRTELEIKLNKDRATTLENFTALPEADLTRGITKSRHDAESKWSAKDHLVHLSGIEKVFNQIIKNHLEGNTRGLADKADGTRPSQEEIMAMVHGMNEAWVKEHRSKSLDEIISLGQQVRSETLALMAGLNDEQFNEAVPTAPFPNATIGSILALNGDHGLQHFEWVKKGLQGNE
jgi:hypothetical protein